MCFLCVLTYVRTCMYMSISKKANFLLITSKRVRERGSYEGRRECVCERGRRKRQREREREREGEEKERGRRKRERENLPSHLTPASSDL